jgi:HAE1 family hydrophobic/amphiphilic exporter-1
MNFLASICIRRPVFAMVLTLVLLVFGVVSYLSLGLDRFPKVDFPIITVTTRLPGSASEEVETEITDKIEEAVNTASGIEELRSVSSEGISQVFVTFVLEKDADVAAQEVRDKVNRVLPDLPRGIDQPFVEKFDPDSIPVMTIAVTAPASIRDLTEYCDKVLRRQLESLDGVGQAMIVGGQKRQINVHLDGLKLRSRHLSVAQVAGALQSQNLQVPGGTVKAGQREYTLRTMGRVLEVPEIARIAVANVAGHTIAIGDLGYVEDGAEEVKSLARLDDTPAVLLNIRKQSGTNTVEVARLLKERLGELRKTAPKDYNIVVVRDQAPFIQAAVDTVTEHLTLGGILAAVVIFFFLANFRTTLISALAIPTSIISAFAVVCYMGFTLNSITLLALALSVGIVIDDAIVVLENIYRFIEEKQCTPFEAAFAATKEIGLAVLSITLSLVAVFLPIAFMGGIVGRFLKSFGVTMSATVLASMIVSFSLTPMLAARWLRKKAGSGEQGAASGEQGAGSGEQGAGSGEQGAASGEQGAGSGEQGAASGEQGAGSGEDGDGQGPPSLRESEHPGPLSLRESEHPGPLSLRERVRVRGSYETGDARTVPSSAHPLIPASPHSLADGRSAVQSRSHAGGSKGGIYARIEGGYMAMLRFSLRHRWVVVACVAGMMALLPVLLRQVRKNFLPDDDQSEFEVNVRAPEGTSLEATFVMLDRIARDVRRLGGVEYTLTSVADSEQRIANEGKVYVRMVPIERRRFDQFQMMDYVRREVLPEYREQGLRINVSPAAIFSGGGMSQADVQFMIGGSDVRKLDEYAQQVIRDLAAVPGAADVDSSLVVGKPQYGVQVDRAKAADLGVSIADVANTLRLLVAGDKASDYNEQGEQYEVHVRATADFRNRLEELATVSVPSSKYGIVALNDVVKFEEGTGPAEINRLNRNRQVTISCNMTPGTSQQTILDAIQQSVERMQMDPGYTTGLLGKSKEMARTFRSFLKVFIMAIIFAYLVIAAQFESWLHPITILLSLPFTLPFALISLLIFGQSLNIFSLLGILVLFAVVKKNSILQIDHTIQLRAAGLSRDEAILAANRDRLRPILMTTVAFVAGMVPLLLSNREGASVNKAISGVVVGGQTLSLLLTLIATPVAYSLFDDLSQLFWRLWGRGFRKKREANRDVCSHALHASHPVGAANR